MKRKAFNALFAVLAISGAVFLAACTPDKPAKTTAQAAEKKIDSTGAKIADGGNTLIIGMDDSFTPMEFRGKGHELMGYDVDLSREAFKRLNIPVDYKSIKWSEKDKELLEDKTIDIIWSALNITDERRKLYALTDPYITNSQVIVVPAGSPITQTSELEGKLVAAQAGGWVKDEILKDPSILGATVRFYEPPTTAQILSEMLAGKADAAVGDRVAVDYYTANSPGQFVVIKSFFETGMGVATRPADLELRNKINKVLAEMKADGTEEAIYKRWFGDRK